MKGQEEWELVEEGEGDIAEEGAEAMEGELGVEGVGEGEGGGIGGERELPPK